MTTISLRLDSVLVEEAGREAMVENRSKAKQIEHWAKLGKAIASELSLADAFTVAQGIKKIKLEPVQSVIIDADDIFNDLENDRKKGLLAQKVTSARIYYEASQKRVGFLDRIDSATGKRETGKFENGRFRAF
ncbi:MAG: ParD-like family protein [Desulfobacteraceae bacterium]|nr:ParD-like family protein [Desulfobacteraceae bacterium]